MNIKKYIDIKFISIYTLWGGIFGIVSLIVPIMFYILIVAFDNNLKLIQLFSKISYFIKTDPIIKQGLIDFTIAIIFFGSFLPMFIIGVVLNFIKNYLTDRNYKIIVFLIGFIIAFLYSSFIFLEMIDNVLRDDEIFSTTMAIVWALSWVLYSAIQGIISIIVLRKFILPKS